ncbi:MAG: type I-E CRISPR-associated protein Cse1/CasA [Rhodococcus sp. (in: high G+C Gram-positive bacteria)]
MTATEASFNLVDEPWIPVRAVDGSSQAMSIGGVLGQSRKIAAVLGDVPTQAFAIQRLLIAIIRRAVEWGDDPVATWTRIWDTGALPAEQIDRYLAGVRARFDLLDPAKPFYQVPSFESNKGDYKPISLLISDVPSGEKYFTTRAGSGAAKLSLAETARWVVHCQAFDFSGIKTGDPRDPRTKSGKGYPIGVAWAGQLGGVLFEGQSLFETLMLNTVLKTSDASTVLAQDLPVWERPHYSVCERGDGTPSGPVDLLTWQSRRIHVKYEDRFAVGVLVGNGDPIQSHNRQAIEFMTRWRFSEVQSKKFGEPRYFPKTFSPDRAMWRGVEGLLADTAPAPGKAKDLAPGTSDWLDLLLERGVLAGADVVRPHAFALEYITQSSVIGAAVDDHLQLRVALFGRTGSHRQYAADAVKAADRAVAALVQLAGNLAEAAGGPADGPRSTARGRGFFLLDQPFRRWVADLGVSEDMEDYLDIWQGQVRSIVSNTGRELIEESGTAAFQGRLVRDRWLDSAIASGFFWSALRKALPNAFDSEREAS